MYRFFWLGVVAFCGVCFIAPSTTYAESVGISPPKISVSVFVDDTREENIIVGRTSTEGMMTFTVTNNEGKFLHIPEGQTVVVPDGAQSVNFPFVIDAKGLSVGEYDDVLSFTLPPMPSDNGATGAMVQIQIEAKIHVSVIDRPDASVALSVKDHPKLIADIDVSNIHVTQNAETDGTMITVEWDVLNNGKNPLVDVSSDARIDGKVSTVYSTTIPPESAVPNNEVLHQSTQFLLPYAYGYGRYTAIVYVGNEEETVTFLVFNEKLRWCFGLLGLSGIFALLAFVVLYTKRKRRQRRR